MGIVATAAGVLGKFKTALADRDAAHHWGNAAKLLTAGVDRVFQTNLHSMAQGIVGDATAFDGITFGLFDASQAALEGYAEGSMTKIISAPYLGASITDLSGIACQLGHCPKEGESALVGVIGAIGSVSKAMWTWARLDEIKKSDPAKGIKNEELPSAALKQTLDTVRYSIWTVSAMAGVVFTYIAAQGNYFAGPIGALADKYSMSLVTNGLRGLLGISGFIISLNLTQMAPVPNQAGVYEEVAAIVGSAQDRQAAMNAMKQSEYNTWLHRAVWFVGDRSLTRTLTKVGYVGLLGARVVGSSIGWSALVDNSASLERWMKDRQSFCKLITVPGWMKNGIKNYQDNLRLDASAAKAWLDWGFDGTYNAFAAPLYLAKKAGTELPTSVNWFLKEATTHWCALFQAAALITEFTYNVESKRYDGNRATASDRLANGATHIKEFVLGTSRPDGDGWRDACFVIDKVAVAALTGVTIYRWYCDAYGMKFASFATLITVLDGAKASVTIAKKLWEDQDNSGFHGYALEKYLKKHGRVQAA